VGGDEFVSAHERGMATVAGDGPRFAIEQAQQQSPRRVRPVS